MQKFITRVNRFLSSEDGPTAVEYAVMLALILVACITIVQSLGLGKRIRHGSRNFEQLVENCLGAGEVRAGAEQHRMDPERIREHSSRLASP